LFKYIINIYHMSSVKCKAAINKKAEAIVRAPL